MIVHTKRAIYHNPTGGEKKGYSLAWAELGAGINKRSQEKKHAEVIHPHPSIWIPNKSFSGEMP